MAKATPYGSSFSDFLEGDFAGLGGLDVAKKAQFRRLADLHCSRSWTWMIGKRDNEIVPRYQHPGRQVMPENNLTAARPARRRILCG